MKSRMFWKDQIESADADTLTDVICSTLKDVNLDLANMTGLSSDGAAVMLGGVARKLKDRNPQLLVIHCVCHRLALACADSNDDLKIIKDVCDYLTTLWKLFEYRNKKMACFMMTQLALMDLKLMPSVKRKVAKKLKKAVKTRCLSSESSVKSAVENYSAIIQSLMKLESSCITSTGLLKKINNPRFLSTLYVLNDVLPILADVSRTRVSHFPGRHRQLLQNCSYPCSS